MKVLLKKNLLNEIRKACDGCRKNCLEDFDHTKRAGSTWLNSQTPKKKGGHFTSPCWDTFGD
jgi:hypothetical protein